MNWRLVLRMLGTILLIEAATMVPSWVIALIYGDAGDARALLISIGLILLIALPMRFLMRPKERNMRARDGFLVVSLSWIVMSLFGALPFWIGGLFHSYVDALFEAVSGFTTTGASVLTSFENTPHGLMFWRSFTHWVGGMGVLVLTLALLPRLTGRTSHLVKAESPGPSLSKVVPKMGQSAKIMYLIYALLTMIQFLLLMLAGMNPYDAGIHALGTAGTGGFSNYGASVGAFNSAAVDWIITVFMVLFGVNFALFYRALTGQWREALKSEELHWYLSLLAISMVAVTLIILPLYGNFFTALRYGSFQVATIVSTTGYATTDFALWPQAAKGILLCLMFVGSCAGSTAGGLKMVRVALLFKSAKREVMRSFQPRKVKVVRFEGKGCDESLLSQTMVFFVIYILLMLLGTLLLSLGGRFDNETNLTAALSCISNVGPGFGVVGPAGSYAGYGAFEKIVLSILMLAGRLELFPMLALFHPEIWRKA